MEASMRTLSGQLTFILALACIYWLGWTIQAHILLNQDVSWLMHVTKRLLAGGTYANDFFELNPPLILYLYIPPVLLAKFSSISIIMALRVYVFLLGTLSLSLCYALAKKLFSPQDKWLAGLFLTTIALTFFVTPIEQFGQREHLLLLLTLPYFLSMACLLNGNPMTRWQAVITGFMAGCGFAIKPYFLMPFFLLELYYLLRTRQALAWCRTEILMIVAVILIYLLVITVIHHDYLATVLPFITRFYYGYFGQSLGKIVTNPAMFPCYLASLFYLLQRRKTACHALRTVLFIALTGFLLSDLMQDTVWYYHLLPAFAFAILLSVLEFAILASQPALSRRDYRVASLMIIMVCGLLAYFRTPLHVTLVFDPFNFFCYFLLIFALLLWLAYPPKNSPVIVLLLGIIIGISYLFTNLLLQSSWYSYRFLPTVIMLMLLFFLCAPTLKMRKSHTTICAALGVMLFAYASYYINYLYDDSLIKISKMTPIITFLQTYAKNKPVTFFTTKSFYNYPAIDYAGAISTSRFGYLGWVPAIITRSEAPTANNDHYLKQDKALLMSQLVDDLNRSKPDYVFVEAVHARAHGPDDTVDFIGYFSADKNFLAAWQPYQYFMTVEDPSMYQFVVYKRLGTS